MSIEYPPQPEPYQLEIELTNHCNAKCVFCPHATQQRPKGFMNVSKLKLFLESLNRVRHGMWMNQRAGKNLFPRVVFAGLGDPTLHPQLAECVNICSELGFQSQVVTNALRLTPSLVQDLIQAGLSSCAISLHSMNDEIYHNLMRLRLSSTLPNIKIALSAFNLAGIATEVWRVLPPPGMPRESEENQRNFESFMSEFPETIVCGPSEPWERDGQVPSSVWGLVRDSDKIWCQKLFFTLSVAWDGTVLMCCVDYHRASFPLGNAFEDGYVQLQQKRAETFQGSMTPSICASCRRWPDTEYQDRIYPLISGKIKDNRVPAIARQHVAGE